MNKVEIEDINELIKKGYSPKAIKKILDDILLLSLKVKEDYPDYKTWYQNKQIPGIFNNTRNIIIAHMNNKVVGFVSLKKTKEEKKICTFYVEKNFQKNKIGTILVEKAINYLEEEKPLITIPIDKLYEFVKIGNKYNWKVTDIQENLYRTTTKEVIVNGTILDLNTQYEQPKELSKVYKIYKFSCLKHFFKSIIYKTDGNN